MNAIDSNLGKHCHESEPTNQVSSTYLSHIAEMPHLTLNDQFSILCSISNYHYMDVPTLKDPRNLIQVKKSRYSNHLVYHEDIESENARQNLPTSPRNRLIYFLSNDAYSHNVPPLIKHLLHLDMPENIDDRQEQPPPMKKRRKQAVKLTRVTNEALLECMGTDVDSLRDLNQANPARTLYQGFQETLLSIGTIKWRLHDVEKGIDVCVMSDYRPDNGILQPSNFVHVTCAKQLIGEPIIKCTCAIYQVFKRAAKQNVPIVPFVDGEDEGEEEVYPEGSKTCMHARFYYDFLYNAYDEAVEQAPTITKPIQMVQKSLQYSQYPVQLLGQVLPQGTTKFSVKGDDSYANVHFTFYQGKCFAKCTNGMCATQMRNKKKVAKTVSLGDADKVCPHLKNVYANFDYVKAFFPHYFNEEDLEFNIGEKEEVNMDDFNVDQEEEKAAKEAFDPETGLWNSNSFTDHKPFMKPNNPLLVRSTRERNDIVHSSNFDENSRMYVGLELKPKSMGNCHCGAGFESSEYVLVNKAKLYTRMGVVDCACYDLPCISGQCTRSFKEVAASKGIFFSTKKTAIGDEIGWDFVMLVKKSKISFSAFCSEMSRRYTTNEIDASPFISPNVFINWFFGWIAAFKIDFRKEVDPWCQHNPKLLACDGTHIGVAVRNLNIQDPVTKIDEPDIVLESKHKRFDRCLIQDKSARKHLRYLSLKGQRKLMPKDALEPEVELVRTAEMMEVVNEMFEDHLAQFIATFVLKTVDEEVLDTMADILYLLSGDAPMSSVLPFQAHDLACSIVEDIRNGTIITQKLEALKEYSVEFSEIVVLGARNECIGMVGDFIEYLVERIKHIHQGDKPAADPEPIPGSYNPPDGTAYYFTPSGAQQRKLPKYVLDVRKKRTAKDLPDDAEPTCKKNYPTVSYGGFGYMFLFFCPIHGHTYGFHMISGGEGRKDPFAALFKYMEEPPEEVFYDFACQLSEYSLNREPHFFKYTRFWHDLFHGTTHLCGDNFKSGRVKGLDGLNTEICEQTNSYLQCLKYTASHLSQVHFVLFMQFFLYLWNDEKTKTYKLTAQTAIAGMM